MQVIWRCDDTGAVDHALYSHFATISMGAPGRCPECDAFGYIEAANLAQRVQSQRCRDCGYRWSYEFDATGTLVEVVQLSTGPGSRNRPTYTARRTDVIDLTGTRDSTAARR